MNKNKSNDIHLIENLLTKGAKEERALGIIYKNNKSLIEQLVLKNAGTKEEAKDVFQDSLIDFYENVQAGKFKGESTISTYLYSIARFKWLNRLKRKKTETRIIDTQDYTGLGESFEEDFIEKEKEEQLMSLFDQLGTSCKDLLIHSIYYNYSMTEIVAKLKFNSEQVARNQKYRCLKKLKELLKNKPDLLHFLKP